MRRRSRTHAFRHGLATELADHSAPLPVLQQQMRHADIGNDSRLCPCHLGRLTESSWKALVSGQSVQTFQLEQKGMLNTFCFCKHGGSRVGVEPTIASKARARRRGPLRSGRDHSQDVENKGVDLSRGCASPCRTRLTEAFRA